MRFEFNDVSLIPITWGLNGRDCTNSSNFANFVGLASDRTLMHIVQNSLWKIDGKTCSSSDTSYYFLVTLLNIDIFGSLSSSTPFWWMGLLNTLFRSLELRLGSILFTLAEEYISEISVSFKSEKGNISNMEFLHNQCSVNNRLIGMFSPVFCFQHF